MRIKRKFLLFVVPIVIAPLVLMWAIFQVAIKPVLSDVGEVEDDVIKLDLLAKEARTEARMRFETAMRQAYSFGLANIGANIDGQLDSLEKSLLIAANRPELIGRLATTESGTPQDAWFAYLQDLILTHSLVEASLVDVSGRPVATLRRIQVENGQESIVLVSDPRTRRQTLGQSWFANLLNSESPTSWSVFRGDFSGYAQSLSVVSGSIAVSGASDGGLAGYLQLVLPVSVLAEVIHGPAELTTSFKLMGEDGQVYWRSDDSEARGIEEVISISQSLRSGLLHAEVTMPRAVVVENIAPFDRVSDAMAGSLIGIEYSNQELHSTIGDLKIAMFIAKVLLASVALAFLWIFIRSISSRIESLNEAAIRIHDGDLDTPVEEIEGKDEIATLSHSVEDMRQRIKGNIRALDRKVEERTAELAKTNDQLKREVVERRKAEISALDASKAKSEFLATMSHEIRTPLSGIQGGVYLLQRSELNEEQKTLCEIVSSSMDTLSSLVNDTLDLAKIEARRVEFEKRQFSIANLVKEIVDTFSFKAQEKGIDLQFEDRLSDTLLRIGDPKRIKQIAMNLVGNAIKFTSEGQIVVSMFESETIAEGVCIEVSDTGIGMTDEEVERVFEPFTQANGSISNEYGGTGLGLAISCRLAEQMGGKLSASSEVGRGSCFRLDMYLPIGMGRDLEAEDAVEAESVPKAPTNGPKSILLAEDKDSNRHVLSRILGDAGFSVTTVTNGRECVDAVSKQRYDLVLMDCNMPVMDGCTATREIRRGETLSKDAIIVGLTAQATADQQDKCMMAGMNDVIFKPVSGNNLIESCCRIVARDR